MSDHESVMSRTNCSRFITLHTFRRYLIKVEFDSLHLYLRYLENWNRYDERRVLLCAKGINIS